MEKKDKTYRIAITGPESTGKSWLAKALADHYNTVWVPDYSRIYVEQLDRKYTYEDILAIAEGQLRQEEDLVGDAKHFLFCDTEFLVCKIWSEEKFSKCDPWIDRMFREHIYDLYLLCSPDLPWQHDPLRENPHDRDRLFERYLKELENINLPLSIISGQGERRLKHAISVIEGFLVND